MDAAEEAKKRKHRRVLILEDLAIDGKREGQAIDLSAEGMYITTRTPFRKDRIITLQFSLEKHPIEVRARVLYRHEGIGMGVRFVSVKPAHSAKIKAYIEKQSASPQTPRRTDRKQILVIDDTNFYQTVYQHRLLSEGYSVLVARNGLEGLKTLMKERPDLILLDLIMEGMDGFKVLQIIKSEPELRDIPVVVFSVRGAAEEVNRAIQMGAADYMIKATTSPLQVMGKIRDVFRHRKNAP